MSIKDMKTINILNYNENVVVVSTKHDSYAIEPAINSENPTTLPLTLDEILYINGNSAAFKSGILRFPQEIEQEMYEDFLRIPNWRDLLTLKEIKNIILHPTMDGLTKLVNIKDSVIFDKVRGVFVKLKNTTDNDISLRVENLINARSDELRRGIRNTSIVIKAKDVVSNVSNDEVDALREQNKELQEQMIKMQEMMQQMMAMQQNPGNSSDMTKTEKGNAEEQQPKGKRGRPPKQNKEKQ